VRRSVIGTKTARRIADICVTTTSIVDVNNRLGVDVSEVVRWSLFQKLESTELLNLAGLLHRDEATVVSVDIAITAGSIGAVELGLGGRSAYTHRSSSAWITL